LRIEEVGAYNTFNNSIIEFDIEVELSCLRYYCELY